MEESYRELLLAYVREQYHTIPEYPWKSAPGSAVLRHEDNRKWYGVIMRVSKETLGMEGAGMTDILNVKCEPQLGAALRMAEGFFPAYHMNKDRWLSICLDGTVAWEGILPLLDASFEMTSGRTGAAKRAGGRISAWLVPANPRYYDVEAGFRESADGTMLWKQSGSMAAGDIVYLYMAAPVSRIAYKCRVEETDIPYRYSDENLTIRRAMRIRLLDCYDKMPVSRELMKAHGVYSVRSARSIPGSLVQEIEMMYPGKTGKEQDE